MPPTVITECLHRSENRELIRDLYLAARVFYPDLDLYVVQTPCMCKIKIRVVYALRDQTFIRREMLKHFIEGWLQGAARTGPRESQPTAPTIPKVHESRTAIDTEEGAWSKEDILRRSG